MLSALVLATCVVAAAEGGISPADAARIAYSTQRYAYLDVGATHVFTLKNGRQCRIRLDAVTERSDSVINLVRSADVTLTIDETRMALVCEPYRMPIERAGLRLAVDTTSAWTAIPGRVQLTLWDASDPIVDTSRFVFPLPNYRLFSQGTQGHNEPVHLGDRDGDPAGQRFHHNYGFDLAGFEGKEPVVSCIDGTVLHATAEDGTLAFQDAAGLVFMYGHLASMLPEIKPGAKVARGAPVGFVGRRGGSGNFSHLHVGLFLNAEDFRADRPCTAFNFYPWLVESYRQATGAKLMAVARPHIAALTGEKVKLDGTRTLVFGAKIFAPRWELPDGASVADVRAETTFDTPGTYAIALWVEDSRGLRDVDFATVRVYTRDKHEDTMPTLFLTYTPSRTVKVGDELLFRLWPQGGEVTAIRLDFGAEGAVEKVEPFTTVPHRFKTSGLHIVTATGKAGGLAVTQKTKVIVE